VFAAYGAVLVWLLLANLALVAVTGGGAVSPGILVASLALNSASLVVASLAAAYMSTISTHLNWGASYIVDDFYRRFVNRDRDDRGLRHDPVAARFDRRRGRSVTCGQDQGQHATNEHRSQPAYSSSRR